MIAQPTALLADFAHVAHLSGFPAAAAMVTHQPLSAPHVPPPLPAGYQAIYVFSCIGPAAPVLKVGKAGANSNARFQFQHYSTTSAQSTLAQSLCNHPEQWPTLGISALTAATVGAWLKQQTDRDHFFLPAAADPFLVNLLEAFLHGRLRPLFEGKVA